MSPEATIAVVIDDQDTRSSMAADLAQRYAAHYRIIGLEAAAVLIKLGCEPATCAGGRG